MSAKVVMVASGKGGTGKSTVSVLFGSRLCAMGQKVLLVELDSGLRSIDMISGVCGQTVYDVQDVLDNRCSCDKAVVESPLYPGLFVIGAPYEGGSVSVKKLKALVAQIQDAFDTVILDTAAGIGSPVRCAAAIAESCILVLTPDPVCLRDGRIVSDLCWNSGVKDIRLLLNRFSTKRFRKSSVDDLDECVDTVCAQLLGVVPDDEELRCLSGDGRAVPADNAAMLALRRAAKRWKGNRVPLDLDGF